VAGLTQAMGRSDMIPLSSLDAVCRAAGVSLESQVEAADRFRAVVTPDLVLELVARIKSLEAALEKYGQHLDCSSFGCKMEHQHRSDCCSCGWEKVYATTLSPPEAGDD